MTTFRRGRTATVGFLREFQDFALKGNVVDLAIAVIIGGAFGKIVSSFVADVVMPSINPLIPGGDWREFTIPPEIKIGAFLGSVVDFIIIALVLFFVIRTLAKFKRGETAAPPSAKDCPYCLESIPIAATRCRACTSEQP
ncbi:large conductance mechanosensitive channel protein MscL [Leptolyngbya sp. FACHB-261]|uniref:large conductance mechanosensitive channel protein MscL n=1 Tax=Leptolyngbya sp. FACHB-261 TaxID=2692806 RepID=UPI0016885B13|nr:large conductance mechanosensitive channel protein MscL [Leptolyngbya sp. FACHB-261]MBD2102993.1 large conductance mechanosensitive channel protein MscL [Leptolyngbya sp. FACHB-261]